MATKPRPTDVDLFEDRKPQNDWESLFQHARNNPVLWTASIAFIVVCALAGTLFRMQRSEGDRSVTSAYARALQLEEPAEVVAALEPIVNKDSQLTAQALYMRGETAIQAEDFETAKASFERLRAEFPDFEFTPDAVEGLGFIAENAEEYPAAVDRYRDVMNSWTDSFAARRQPFNIGRAQERAGNFDGAIAAYRQQLEAFPGSNVSRRAQEALDRLRDSNPELFEGEGMESETPLLDLGATPVEPQGAAPAEEPVTDEALPAPTQPAEPSRTEENPDTPVSSDTPVESETPVAPEAEPTPPQTP